MPTRTRRGGGGQGGGEGGGGDGGGDGGGGEGGGEGGGGEGGGLGGGGEGGGLGGGGAGGGEGGGGEGGARVPKWGDHRRLVLERFDVLKIQGIDSVTESFTAACFVVIRFPDGAADEGLKANGTDGNALWYASRIESYNHYEHDSCKGPLQPKVDEDGNDLRMQMRFEGRFLVAMNLREFPFDVQSLRLEFLVTCRVDGPMKIQLEKAQDVISSTVERGFHPKRLWQLSGKPTVQVDVHDANGRRFSTFWMTQEVTRRPEYYLANIALPIAVISGLAITALPSPAEAAGRLDVALTLLLSLTTYKFAVTSMIPQVSYQTLLDRYVLCNFIFLAAVALAVGLLPRCGGGGGGGGGGGSVAVATSWTAYALLRSFVCGAASSCGATDGGFGGGGDTMDGACFVVFSFAWCGIQLWHH